MFRKFMSLLLCLSMVMSFAALTVVAEEPCNHVYDQYGNCDLCGDYCRHQWDAQSYCPLCGNTCTHDYVDYVCTICHVPCPHEMEGELCGRCGLTCSHENHHTDGSCTVCNTSVAHSYVDGVCAVCGGEDPDYVKPTEPVEVDYYLVGYIDGADYGCNDDWQNLGEIGRAHV